MMRALINFLPLLMIIAFPMLYFGAGAGDKMLSLFGIVTLFVGMAGPILKSIK